MVRISHFSLERKISLKWNETSRDFNFAVKTQCKFYIFVVTSFGKQKIKICNLVFSLLKTKGKIKALQTDTLSICFALRDRWWTTCAIKACKVKRKAIMNEKFYVVCVQIHFWYIHGGCNLQVYFELL